MSDGALQQVDKSQFTEYTAFSEPFAGGDVLLQMVCPDPGNGLGILQGTKRSVPADEGGIGSSQPVGDVKTAGPAPQTGHFDNVGFPEALLLPVIEPVFPVGKAEIIGGEIDDGAGLIRGCLPGGSGAAGVLGLRIAAAAGPEQQHQGKARAKKG